MTASTFAEIVVAFLNLLRKFEQGDARATQRLKDILPERTFTRMVKEREKMLDLKKFGGS